MKVEVVLSEADIAQEFAEAIEARDLPEKFFFWFPRSATEWAALEASMRYLASDLGQQKIRVNCISAGPIKTASARAIKNFSSILEVNERTPLRRNTDPAEVADAAVFLASDLGRGVTGNVLFVDAGMQIMAF